MFEKFKDFLDDNLRKRKGYEQRIEEMENPEKISAEIGEMVKKVLPEFHNLVMDLEYSSVSIKTTDKNDFSLKIELNTPGEIYYIVKDDTLYLEDEDLGFQLQNSHKITITLPENFVFNKMEGDISMGSFKMQEISCSKGRLDVSMGSIKLEDLSLEDFEIKMSMGSFKGIDLSVTNSKVKSSMGSINILGGLLGKNEIGTSMGSIKLELEQDPREISIRTKTDMGSMKIDDESEDNSSKTYKYKYHEPNTLRLKSSMGSIHVNFI
ncbi:DUF4097 family beta strand repeat-containing protein [Lagierella sp.]|uniref:DUF4097 family beta strand repeat-containing protein n=1 Tax=Lagierella sp. TaxID=2849657 RepID=UPI002617B70E|nr:DUF4097 family beta strand repeat-containing protein [Lagierella sp.]